MKVLSTTNNAMRVLNTKKKSIIFKCMPYALMDKRYKTKTPTKRSVDNNKT